MTIRMLNEYLQNGEISAEAIAMDEAIRKHADGTPCHAKSPDSCPFNQKAEAGEKEITGNEKSKKNEPPAPGTIRVGDKFFFKNTDDYDDEETGLKPGEIYEVTVARVFPNPDIVMVSYKTSKRKGEIALHRKNLRANKPEANEDVGEGWGVHGWEV